MSPHDDDGEFDPTVRRVTLAADPALIGSSVRTDDGRVAVVETPTAYFRARLWHACYATQVFIELSEALALANDDDKARVDDEVAAAYWNDFGGVLLPMRLLKHLSLVSDLTGGGDLIDRVDAWIAQIGRADSYEQGRRAHAAIRAELLDAFDRRQYSLPLFATGELVADCLLIQRAVADDIRRAERERAPEQARGEMLIEYDRQNAMMTLDATRYVLAPQRVFDQLPPSAQAVAAQVYTKRGDLDLRGVISGIGPLL